VCSGGNERRVVKIADGLARDGKDVHMDGSRRIVEERITRGDDDDVGFREGHAATLTISPIGGRALPCRSDVAPIAEEQSPRMITAYPLIWSASIIEPLAMQSDVNVLVRVTYNTLEAICRDAFVLTESQAVAATSARFFLSSSAS
jgi:hypothetical protein